MCDGVVLPQPLEIGHISWLDYTAIHKTGNIIFYVVYVHRINTHKVYIL